MILAFSEKAPAINNDSLLITNILSELRNNWQDVPRVLSLCSKASEIATNSNDKKLLSSTYYKIAVVNLEILKNHNQTLAYLIKALAIADEIKDSSGIERCYQAIGNTYSDLYDISGNEEDFKDAEKNLLKALKINRNLLIEHRLANNYCNLSDLYLINKDGERSLFYATEAGKVYTRNKDIGGLRLTNSNICRSLLMFANKTGNKKDYINCRNKFKEYYNSTGLNVSKEKFDSVAPDGKFWLMLNLSIYYTYMAEIEEFLGDHPKQFNDLTDSAEYFSSQTKNIKNLVYVLKIKAKHFEKLQPVYSLQIKNKIIRLLDSNYVIETQKKNESLKAIYQFNQNEAQYAFVQAENKMKSIELISEKKQNDVKNKLLVTSIISIIIFCAFLFYFISLNKKLNFKNKLVSEQKEVIQIKNKQITDSVNFSKIIQDEILYSNINLKNYFKDYFLMYLPKDIVSGDFYFVEEKDDKLIIAVIDCTGHGISGAMMSLHANSLLQSVFENTASDNSAVYMDELNKSVQSIFSSVDNNEFTSKFGMDVSLLIINKVSKMASFCSTGNPLFVKTIKDFREFKPQKATLTYSNEKYNSLDFEVNSENQYYLFTDGFYDQKGGENGKKFMFKNFKELISANSHLNLNEQNNEIMKIFLEWQRKHAQTDDITIIGFKV